MKVKYEQIVSSVPVYESIDGTNHPSKYLAIRHDAVVLAGTRDVASSGIYLPDDETYMRVFNITCQEDWDYLYYTEWEQNIFGDKYTHPGWYGSIRHDGGDYADSYEIIRIDEDYYNRYETFINDLNHLTFE